MNMTKLNRIPHISLEQISDTFIRITAPDFSLNCTLVDTLEGKFWKFDPASQVTDITNFNLRHLIHRALN